jgi:hypothetical protein
MTSLTPGASSTFLWTVTNGACSATSSVTITVVTPIVFTTDPLTQTLCTGSPLTLTGAVTGTGTITYQWNKGASNVSNGGTVSGATTPSLSISSLVAGDAGSYTLVATNTCGAVTSNAGVLTVSSSVLSITTQPLSQVLCSGSNVTLAVVATGTGALTYLWKKNGVGMSDGGRIAGATTTSLTISTLVAGDADDYSVDVSNTCGTISSNDATLTIDAPIITTQPSDQLVCPGANVTFNVVASGPSLTYQWQKNAVDIPTGGNAATLVVSNASASDETNYLCKVTACATTVNSNAANLQLDICTGAVDASNSQALLLYPNPTRQVVHIQTRANDLMRTITIVNSTGHVVYLQQQVGSDAVDVKIDHLAEGLYHVIIDAEQGRRVEKLEVIN